MTKAVNAARIQAIIWRDTANGMPAEGCALALRGETASSAAARDNGRQGAGARSRSELENGKPSPARIALRAHVPDIHGASALEQRV
jgi:hypothetical protein